MSIRTLFTASICALAAAAAEFPSIYNSQPETIVPLKPTEALKRIALPAGFTATLFAAEPAVQQPIAMTFDARGRLWVAENFTYAETALNFDSKLRDRITILHDADGDGEHDSRKIFWDQAERLTSIAVGFGGVYALCPPYLLFLPDRNGDDLPDSEPEMLLDGFEYERNRHTLANGLKWGPDGWLYGRQGIQANSIIGKPGTPESERVTINTGIWRYHPVRRVFEVVAQGTTNPWGSDWDENGELYFINTVIGHLWHAIPGAYFKRMYGQALNPYIYEEIEQVADHVHWDTREQWLDVRQGVSSGTLQAGGGHAHTGLMIYQGGNWPREFHGDVFTLNYHGKRINRDRLAPSGATYAARHAPDFMSIDDPYFRGIEILSGPEGAVYVADWSDIGECHDNNGVHRTSGRIYRIAFGSSVKPSKGDLTRSSNAELVQRLSDPNEWVVGKARQLLQERALQGMDLTETRSALRELLNSADRRLRLRALWALYAIQAADTPLLLELLGDRDAHLRVWAIRLLVDAGTPPSAALERFAEMARKDDSGLVLCYLASALQRIPFENRWNIARGLASRAEFNGDRVMPLLTWYGIEPAVPRDAELTVALVKEARLHKLRELCTRRVFDDFETQQTAGNGIVAWLAHESSPDARLAVLTGIHAGLEGVQQPKAPQAWGAAEALLRANNPDVRRLALELDAIFGNTVSQEALLAKALDPAIELPERRRALNVALRTRATGTARALETLLGDKALAGDAVRGFAAIGGSNTPQLLLGRSAMFDPATRQEVINTLAARPSSALALARAVQRGVVQRKEISAPVLRQLKAYDQPELKELLALVWPAAEGQNNTPARLFAKYRALLSNENLQQANPVRGRELYIQTCGACHKLYGEGGAVGPELTGSDRQNLDYLLENIITPSAVVPDGYRASSVELKDDRVLNGIIVARDDQSITLQTLNERLVLPRAEIESLRESQLSMMPEGLLDPLSDQQVLDLASYLMSSSPPRTGGGR